MSGDDAGLFSISEDANGANIWTLGWIENPNYEDPKGGSEDNSNTYIVTANVEDNFQNSSTTTLFINVNDINELPVLNVDATSTVSATENFNSSYYSVTDDDAGDTVTWG